MCGSKGKQVIYHLLMGSRDCSATSQASVRVVVALEDKHRSNECPPFLLLSLSFYCCSDVIWYGTALWSVWVSCPGYVPSQDLAHPQLAGGGGRCWRDSLDAVLSGSQHTGVLSAPF